MSRETEHSTEKEVAAAWAELSPAQRAKLARSGITGPDSSYRVNGLNGHATEEEVERLLGRQATAPAPFQEAPEDELRELAPSLTLADARALVAWHKRELDDAVTAHGARILHRVIATLIRPGLNHLLASWALAFATGLDCVTGVRSQNACALKLKVDRQLLNYYVTIWRDQLGFATRKFCRTEEARAAYQSRAIKVHRRRGEA